jgi:hypothetical protein
MAPIHPRDYEETLREQYFQAIAMSGQDLRDWYRRLRRGDYER